MVDRPSDDGSGDDDPKRELLRQLVPGVGRAIDREERAARRLAALESGECSADGFKALEGLIRGALATNEPSSAELRDRIATDSTVVGMIVLGLQMAQDIPTDFQASRSGLPLPEILLEKVLQARFRIPGSDEPVLTADQYDWENVARTLEILAEYLAAQARE